MVRQFFKELNIVLPWDSAIPFLGVYTPNNWTRYQTSTCTCTFTAAALFTIAKDRQPKCPSMHEGKIKFWSIHKMEYYPAIPREDALTHATTWINLKNVMLNERCQTQKVMFYDYIYVKYPKEANPYRQKVDDSAHLIGQLGLCCCQDYEEGKWRVSA